jgi:putative FmdB family regulatory protein
VRYNAPSVYEQKEEVSMPVYTYRCDNCGVQFEKQQSFSDQSLIRCPECGKKALKKVYQPVGIVFKGSGFYATDHHSPSGQSSKKEEKEEKEKKEEKKEIAESKESETKAEKSSDKKEGSGNKETTTKPEKSSETKE